MFLVKYVLLNSEISFIICELSIEESYRENVHGNNRVPDMELRSWGYRKRGKQTAI